VDLPTERVFATKRVSRQRQARHHQLLPQATYLMDVQVKMHHARAATATLGLAQEGARPRKSAGAKLTVMRA
jgi:hypothetical protein